MSAFKHMAKNTDTTSLKLEKASLTAWSLMSSGRKIVTKIGSFPFLRGPTRFRKFRCTSELLKRHWISIPASFSFGVLDPKTKTNFEGETLHRAPTSVKISYFRIFLGVSSEYIVRPISNLYLIQAEWFSSRDLCLTLLVRELFIPAEFGSKFSSGAKQSSFASTKKAIYLTIYRWLFIYLFFLVWALSPPIGENALKRHGWLFICVKYLRLWKWLLSL